MIIVNQLRDQQLKASGVILYQPKEITFREDREKNKAAKNISDVFIIKYIKHIIEYINY